ncbi:unnamed protein product [Rhizophagus irregularis]|nr:unnamed protein product [Rhizophagus irregularis]
MKKKKFFNQAARMNAIRQVSEQRRLIRERAEFEKKRLETERKENQAKYHGTSVKHIYRRQHERDRVFTLCDIYHDVMTDIIHDDRKRSNNKLDTNFQAPLADFDDELLRQFDNDDRERYLCYAFDYESDDTKRLEARPNKRTEFHHAYPSRFRDTHTSKRIRHDSLNHDGDSPMADPSN